LLPWVEMQLMQGRLENVPQDGGRGWDCEVQRGVGVVAGLPVRVGRCSSVLLGFRGRSGNEYGVP